MRKKPMGQKWDKMGGIIQQLSEAKTYIKSHKLHSKYSELDFTMTSNSHNHSDH